MAPIVPNTAMRAIVRTLTVRESEKNHTVKKGELRDFKKDMRMANM